MNRDYRPTDRVVMNGALLADKYQLRVSFDTTSHYLNMPVEELHEYAMKSMAMKIADEISKTMEVESVPDLKNMREVLTAELFVLSREDLLELLSTYATRLRADYHEEIREFRSFPQHYVNLRKNLNPWVIKPDV
ncbi:hypothetical protein D1872_81280 [compost metagenome]